MDFEFRVTRAINTSAYSKYVDYNGFIVGEWSTFIGLESTTAELGGTVQADALSKRIAAAVFARVPDLKSVTVSDKNDVDIGEYLRPPSK